MRGSPRGVGGGGRRRPPRAASAEGSCGEPLRDRRGADSAEGTPPRGRAGLFLAPLEAGPGFVALSPTAGEPAEV